MRIAVISFTEKGSQLNRKLCGKLRGLGYLAKGYEKRAEKEKAEDGEDPQEADQPESVRSSLKDWAGRAFLEYDGLIFIGACGIAVRAVAPFLKDKFTDPAVVVMDEQAGFAVSLLSGHVGGANELAALAAGLTGAVPVISTATDVNGRFAVDVFAVKNGLFLLDRSLAKQVSAFLLAGNTIPFYSSQPVGGGKIPEELCFCETVKAFREQNGLKVAVSERVLDSGKDTLYLIPRTVTVGMGCRRGVSEGSLKEALERQLLLSGIFKEALEQIATIDVKKEEEGLLKLSKTLGLPICFYSGQELSGVPGVYTGSDFVKKTVGVDSVCERAAAAGSGNGCVLLRKQAGNGITIAAARRKIEIRFEEENED